VGERGPVRKRSEERLGHRSKAEKEGVTRVPRDAAAVPRPAPNPSWHPVAKSWYMSLGHSGQSDFYEPSDWMTAVWLADQMSLHYQEIRIGTTEEGDPIYGVTPMSGQVLSAFLKGMTSLLATEGDRRRAAVELGRRQAEEDEDAQIIHLVRDEEQEAFGG